MRLILSLIFFVSCLSAETSMNNLFSDGMVLQRHAPVKIWGTDIAGQAVSVSINGKSTKATADANGKWTAMLPAFEAGGPFELEVQGSSTIMIKDVLIGEVWLCTGQSNMAFPLKWLSKNPTNPQNAKSPHIRMFTVPKKSGGDKESNVNATWKKADGSIADWSATAFHFGNELHKHLDVPVGLILSSVGGTPIESWVDMSTLKKQKDISGHVGWILGQVKKYPKAKAELDKKIKAWQKNGKKGKKPSAHLFAPNSPWRPAGLYNGMIAPLAGYTIKGAIWYQGESNVGRFTFYGETLRNLITDWRSVWGQGDFPFITVQLANHKKRSTTPQVKSTWAGLREAQNTSLQLKNTGVTVTIDIGDGGDIHPTNKLDVGKRSALIARKIAYGEDLVHCGPFYKSHEVKGSEVHISFDNLGGGLEAKGGKLKAFTIAGEDKKFVWADASIKGDNIVVSSDKVPTPKHVSYGWADNPDCNLYNKEGLPASPFRFDTE